MRAAAAVPSDLRAIGEAADGRLLGGRGAGRGGRPRRTQRLVEAGAARAQRERAQRERGREHQRGVAHRQRPRRAQRRVARSGGVVGDQLLRAARRQPERHLRAPRAPPPAPSGTGCGMRAAQSRACSSRTLHAPALSTPFCGCTSQSLVTALWHSSGRHLGMRHLACMLVYCSVVICGTPKTCRALSTPARARPGCPAAATAPRPGRRRGRCRPGPTPAAAARPRGPGTLRAPPPASARGRPGAPGG